MTSTQHVRVEGTSYQRGRQYGRQAAARVRLSVQAYQQAFAHFAGWDWATVRREAARFEAPVGTFRPAYLEEMRGIADGAGLDLTDVLAINVRTRGDVLGQGPPRGSPSGARRHRGTRRVQRLRACPGPGSARSGHPRPELGLAPARGPDPGRAGGPARRGPGLRHRGRGRPAGQGRDERRRPRPGHQRPGDRRGRRRARAAVPRAAARRARLRHGDRSRQGPPGRPAVLVGQLPDRPRQRRRPRYRGGARRLHPPVPAVPRGRRAPAHQPLPGPARRPGRPGPVGHAQHRGPAAAPPGRRRHAPSRGLSTTSAPCWPITPTTRTASAPTPTRPITRASRAPPSPPC